MPGWSADYGPLGVELKNNIKRAWWRSVVYERDDMVGLDAGILMNRLAWKYSGHEATFSDPLVDCRKLNCRGSVRSVEPQTGHLSPSILSALSRALHLRQSTSGSENVAS